MMMYLISQICLFLSYENVFLFSRRLLKICKERRKTQFFLLPQCELYNNVFFPEFDTYFIPQMFSKQLLLVKLIVVCLEIVRRYK